MANKEQAGQKYQVLLVIFSAASESCMRGSGTDVQECDATKATLHCHSLVYIKFSEP